MTPATLGRRTSIGLLQLLEKPFAIDHDAGDPTGADESAPVLGRDGEGQASSLDLLKHCFGAHGFAHRSGVVMVEADLDADRGLALVQRWRQGLDGRRLTERDQARGTQDGNITRADRQGGVVLSDDQLEFGSHSCFNSHGGYDMRLPPTAPFGRRCALLQSLAGVESKACLGQGKVRP